MAAGTLYGHRTIPESDGPFARETLTVSSTAVPFTAATALNATAAMFSVDDAEPIRWTVDGTTPTTDLGHLASQNDVVVLIGKEVAGFQAFRDGANDATLMITYYRPY